MPRALEHTLSTHLLAFYIHVGVFRAFGREAVATPMQLIRRQIARTDLFRPLEWELESSRPSKPRHRADKNSVRFANEPQPAGTPTGLPLAFAHNRSSNILPSAAFISLANLSGVVDCSGDDACKDQTSIGSSCPTGKGSTCSINCVGDAACSGLAVFTAGSERVVLKCIGEDACEDADFSSATSNYIYCCEGDKACENMGTGGATRCSDCTSCVLAQDEPADDVAQTDPGIEKLVEEVNQRCDGAPTGGSWDDLGRPVTAETCETTCLGNASCHFAVYSVNHKGCSTFGTCSLVEDTTQKWTVFQKDLGSGKAKIAEELSAKEAEVAGFAAEHPGAVKRLDADGLEGEKAEIDKVMAEEGQAVKKKEAGEGVVHVATDDEDSEDGGGIPFPAKCVIAFFIFAVPLGLGCAAYAIREKKREEEAERFA